MEPITNYLIQSTVHEKNSVKAWYEDILLPTYEIGAEEKNPMFLEKRVYQGSSGVVYPYAVVEKVSDEKVDKLYKAVFIENEYLKIMILPELGGRIHMAYDKVKQRHFVYYNQVIKPALVGLTGPWISGGIEFNWPQHHRPSTFLSTESSIEKHADGSITVWCNEVERLFRMKGMQGFRLHPGKAYLEINVKVYNRSALPQTFLWWANPAVVVNDSYKSVFPPDVHAVFDHGKRDVSNFPIATGEYYKQDYSAGVDISKYKNIPVPTSYMAIKSKYDFVGGYQDDQQAGLLHVANHHVSPGKKQWTWGNGDFGLAWDRNLTDEDGPYIELMTGVYTDNQPDFTWIQPNEEKTWTQYFMPYAEVGYVKNATKDVLLNVEVLEQNAHITIYTSSVFHDLSVVVRDLAGSVLWEEQCTVAPDQTYKVTVPVGSLTEDQLRTEIVHQGKVILAYQADKPEIVPTPEAAKAAKEPKDIASVEQLFLTGQHLEQYRHATFNPLDYYQEALRREPSDIRSNNALGLLLLRKGQFALAESYFRTAIKTQTERNPNPYDGEAHYNLGLALKLQNKYADAYEYFFKATWNAAYRAVGYHQLAQLDMRKGNLADALAHSDQSLIYNGHDHKGRHLKSAALRLLKRNQEASNLIDESLALDQFNLGCRFEKYLLTGDEQDLYAFKNAIGDSVHNYLEYALDYANAGLYDEAVTVLEHADTITENQYPILIYAKSYFHYCAGSSDHATDYLQLATTLSPEKCFPNRLEEIQLLEYAMRMHPRDYVAPLLLGNLWYANRQYQEAKYCWEKSLQWNDKYPTTLRNLALSYFNKFDKPTEARDLLEKAFALDTSDARIFMELDQLYKKLNMPAADRLLHLQSHMELISQRDDLLIEYITLLNQTGAYEHALSLMDTHQFHPWEGGEGKITKQYVLCRVELAKLAIQEQHYQQAIDLLEETDRYPHNLGEGKLANVQENDIHYYKGIAYRALGDEQQAENYLQLATCGAAEPAQAFFYNDVQPDSIYYQGLAYRELGHEAQARARFNKLIDHGKKHLFDTCKIDYFAVSLPDLAIWEDDLDKRNSIHCHYVMALGHLGLQNMEIAKQHFDKITALDVNHINSQVLMNNLTSTTHA